MTGKNSEASSLSIPEAPDVKEITSVGTKKMSVNYTAHYRGDGGDKDTGGAQHTHSRLIPFRLRETVLVVLWRRFGTI